MSAASDDGCVLWPPPPAGSSSTGAPAGAGFLGDMVVLNGRTGIVEDFGLRLTPVRLYDGGQAIIPTCSISQGSGAAPP